jgi:diphthamide biosynthesis protein 7
VFSEDIAPTYFTWAANSSQTMAITTSDGGVYLVHFSPGYDSFQILNGGEPVTKHTEYAWCCSFSSSGDRLYSGGDDNKLRLENLGISLSSLDPKSIIEASGLYPKGLPGHEAGVTFILPVPLPSSDEQPQLLLTGSYDDHIRIYSVPSYPSRPKVLTELSLGGGVWRLRFLDPPVVATGYPNQSIRYTVLASCMHAGARILSILGTKEDGDIWSEWKWDINVLAEMNLHKSMNYASDVQDISEERDRICVSSSFYDRLLCVWKWDPDKSMA